MLRKLMKYEFKATGRIFMPLFGALLIISAVNRLLSGITASSSNAPVIISTTVAIMLMVAVFVTVFILTIQRFRQNLLSNEGHLMMTLPVKTDSLILSKLFTASAWAAASFIITLAAILIMTSSYWDFSGFAGFFRQLGIELSRIPAGYIVLYIIEGLFFIALAIFTSILTLYACMALSMLVNRRRGLFTFGMFIAISTVLQIIASIVGAVFYWLEREFKILSNINSGLSGTGQAQLVIVTVLAIIAALCAAFYFTTRYMLKDKLNLQ